MKKNFIYAIATLTFMLIVVGCTNNAKVQQTGEENTEQTVEEQAEEVAEIPALSWSTPEDVARMLLDGLVAKDVAAVEKCLGIRKPHQDAVFLTSGTDYYGGFKSYEILGSNVYGNIVSVNYLVHFGNGESQKDSWELVKQSDGTWKAKNIK